MAMQRNTGDLRPTADHWDGPFHRPFLCGEVRMREVEPPRALFMDAMQGEGSWLITLSGFGYYKLGSNKHLLDAGQMLALRKPARGFLVPTEEGLPWNYLWVNVTGEESLRMFDFIRGRFGTFQTIPTDSPVVRKGRRLIRLVRERPHRSPHFWSQLTFEFLDAWWECAEQECSPISGVLTERSYDSRLLSFAPGTIKHFAEEMGYSRSYLSRKLKEQWDEPPGMVLRRTRLEEAARLLRTTNHQVKDISERIGYQSATAFIRAFGSQYGESPLAYRHTHR